MRHFWVRLGLLFVALSSCASVEDTGGVVYVDPSAQLGGEGTSYSPYSSLTEALSHSGPMTHIMMAEGRVLAPAEWRFTESVTLAGWGHSDVTLVTGDGGDISWSASSSVAVSNLSIEPAVSLSGELWMLTNVTLESAADPLRVTDGTLRMVGGLVHCRGERAVVLANSRATLEGTVVLGGARTGVAITDGADVTLLNSQVSGSNVNLFVSASTLIVEDSEVFDGEYAGALVGGESHISVHDSSFRDNKEGHITVLGPNVSVDVQGLVAENAPMDSCISITDTTLPVSIVNSDLSGCAGAGVNAYWVSDLTVKGSTIRDIHPDLVVGEMADGVNVLDTQGIISENTITDVQGNGVAVLRSSAQVLDNQIVATGNAGVDVVDQSGPATRIAGNRIESSRTAGVIVLNAEAIVEQNEIEGSIFRSDFGLGEGIAFGMGADVIIRENTISANERNGILFMDGASGHIEANHFLENQRYGIFEFCVPDFAENDVTISENTYTQNGLGEQQRCEK